MKSKNTDVKTALVDFFNEERNHTALESSFGRWETNAYINWFFINYNKIDITDYINKYSDFTLEGLVEDMCGMYMMNMPTWKEYSEFNEYVNGEII
jgi:hypothetical protein